MSAPEKMTRGQFNDQIIDVRYGERDQQSKAHGRLLADFDVRAELYDAARAENRAWAEAILPEGVDAIKRITERVVERRAALLASAPRADATDEGGNRG